LYSYPHCASIRLWQTACEDEGVRSICEYLDLGKPVTILELLDNKITALGCEFISKSLHPSSKPTIAILKLDHNNFGAQGVKNLSEGLAVNPTLKILSLQYCGIDEHAAQALFEILIYTRSALEDINLSGNMLGNEGIKKILHGTAVNKALKKIWLSDNQFNDDEDVLKAIMFCWVKNTHLLRYDFKYNIISSEGLQVLTQCLTTEAQHVYDVEIPERIDDKVVFKEFSEALKGNKPKGRKGKGKGKKKKK
jgi:Ran GTPase-activating protein (RanGAP) involved in mRNA processing and transport